MREFKRHTSIHALSIPIRLKPDLFKLKNLEHANDLPNTATTHKNLEIQSLNVRMFSCVPIKIFDKNYILLHLVR